MTFQIDCTFCRSSKVLWTTYITAFSINLHYFVNRSSDIKQNHKYHTSSDGNSHSLDVDKRVAMNLLSSSILPSLSCMLHSFFSCLHSWRFWATWFMSIDHLLVHLVTDNRCVMKSAQVSIVVYFTSHSISWLTNILVQSLNHLNRTFCFWNLMNLSRMTDWRDETMIFSESVERLFRSC